MTDLVGTLEKFLAQVDRLLRFVETANTRYQKASEEVLARLQRELQEQTEPRRVIMATRQEIGQACLLHYEIESFILFAKTLLDYDGIVHPLALVRFGGYSLAFPLHFFKE